MKSGIARGVRMNGSGRRRRLSLRCRFDTPPPALTISPHIPPPQAAIREPRPVPVYLSTTPRVVFYENFLTDEECDRLIALGEGKVEDSTVVDNSTGGSKKDSARTSKGTFLPQPSRSEPWVAAIEERVARYSGVPRENGEPIQLLQYMLGQEVRIELTLRDMMIIPYHDHPLLTL
jgi:prolyl 4-hydroxylase